jgi:enoyl-CoA hydratase/carnithine racemase
MAVRDEGRVRREVKDGVGVVTLDRPRALNALSSAMLTELARILGEPPGDAVRALVLTGEGRAFSAGIDLYELEARRARGETEEEARERLETIQDVTRRLAASPIPVIAAVNGPAVGLGAEIAVAADLRIMARAAGFSFPEARRGLSGTNGVSYLLPRLVGAGRALDWLLTGREVGSEEAETAGLVSAVVAGEDLLAAALERGRWIADSPPGGIVAARGLLSGPGAAELEAALRREVEVVLERMRSPEYEAGLRAFVERRS